MTVPLASLNGRLELVLALPVEVPVLDPDQRGGLAVGRLGDDLHLLADVVHVRRDPDRLDINRQRGTLRGDMIASLLRPGCRGCGSGRRCPPTIFRAGVLVK